MFAQLGSCLTTYTSLHTTSGTGISQNVLYCQQHNRRVNGVTTSSRFGRLKSNTLYVVDHVHIFPPRRGELAEGTTHQRE